MRTSEGRSEAMAGRTSEKSGETSDAKTRTGRSKRSRPKGGAASRGRIRALRSDASLAGGPSASLLASLSLAPIVSRLFCEAL